jgi:hypothetical protein
MWLGGRGAVLSGDAAPRHAIVAYALGCIRVYRAQKDEATQEPEHHDNVSHMTSPTRSWLLLALCEGYCPASRLFTSARLPLSRRLAGSSSRGSDRPCSH